MKLHDADWDAVVLESAEVVTQVDVLLAGQPVPDGEAVAVEDGSATFDRRQAIRGRLDATFAEPLAVPRSSRDLLSPQGYELFVQQGFRYRGGRVVMQPIGIFPIQRSTFDSDLITSVSTMDRAQTVSEARLESEHVIAGGVLYTDAIQELLLAGVPWLEFAFPTIEFTTPTGGLVFATQADRWEAGQSMAKACGCELYFDGLGRCSLLPEPALRPGSADWTIEEGETGALEHLEIERDRQYVYNRVVAWSTNAGNDTLYSGVATDLDPASPTYYFGPFGRKPRFYASEFITSNAQATSAALAILNANLGLVDGLSLDALPNPALEAGDIIQITRTEMGVIGELHIVDAITIGLGELGGMSVESRSRQDQGAA